MMQTYVRFERKLYLVSQAAGYMTIDSDGSVFVSNFPPYWNALERMWLITRYPRSWQQLTAVTPPKHPELEYYILEEE